MCSHKCKDTNISDGIFILLPESPGGSHGPGVGLWALGVPRWLKKFKHGHVAYQFDEDDEQNRMQAKFSSHGQTGDLRVRTNIIKFRLPCQFQRFLYQTLCVFSQMKDTKHFRRDFYSVACVMPQGWDFGALGVPKGAKKSNMVTWHIKLTGMTSRTEYK